MAGNHDRIIAKCAKDVLYPIGLRRKGRSRTWFSDHGWWASVVEFQPSAWSKGAYLNVAAHWLWSDSDYISFDFGGRVSGFVAYDSDDGFEDEMSSMAKSALAEVQRLQGLFIDLGSTFQVLVAEADRSKDVGWMAFHAGVAAGCIGLKGEAKRLFEQVVGGPASTGSLLRNSAMQMLGMLGDDTPLAAAVLARITRHREVLGLVPQNAGSFAPLSSSGVTAV